MKSAVATRCWRWDGEVILPLRSGLPLSDRGFRYGWHLFESLAVRSGRVLLIREHLDLLEGAAARNGLPFPRRLRPALRRFLTETRIADGMIRIYLTAGAGAPADPVTDPECFLAWERTSFPSRADLLRGYALTMGKQPVRGWGEKSGNYLAHCMALREARLCGFDEVVMSDEAGRVVSCSMGNILVWPRSGESVLTPSPVSGARSGAVLSWLRKHAGVEEAVIRVRDLSGARALAVTNSRLGVMPVVRLDGRLLPGAATVLELAEEYLKRFCRG